MHSKELLKLGRKPLLHYQGKAKCAAL